MSESDGELESGYVLSIREEDVHSFCQETSRTLKPSQGVKVIDSRHRCSERDECPGLQIAFKCRDVHTESSCFATYVCMTIARVKEHTVHVHKNTWTTL